MKKLLTTVLIAVLFILTLVGCSEQTDNPTPEATPPVVDATPEPSEQAGAPIHVEQSPIAEHSVLGFVVAMSEDSIIVEYITSQEISSDETAVVATEYQETIRLMDDTIFELWEHDGQQITRQLEVSKHELLIDDSVDAYGFFEHGEFFAERIVILRNV